MKRSKFFTNTAILTSSNLITGTLTFIYSIILSKKIGSEGMGLYQLVMPLYNLFLVVTGGGITVSMSKIAAEKKATGKMNELYKTVKALCIIEIIWSVFITSLIAISTGFISSHFLSDERTALSILAFCPALIIISISSIFKGTYYGIQKIVTPAIIDVIEKIVRTSMMIFLVSLTQSSNLKITTAAAVLSLSFGEFSSLVLFYTSYHFYKKKHAAFDKGDNSFQLSFNVLKLSFPLAINGILSTLFGTITTVLIPNRLSVSGMSYDDAISMLGKLEGMALNIAFYPIMFVQSLNILMIPAISEAITFKKNNLINHRINSAFKYTSAVAFASFALFMAFSQKIGYFFFKDNTIGTLLKYTSYSLPFVYIQASTFAILNGLGRQTTLLINSIAVSIFDLICLYVLLAIPSINIKGYAIDLLASSCIGFFINLFAIKHYIDYKFDWFHIFILPFLCSILTYFIGIIIAMFTENTPLLIILFYLIFTLIYAICSKVSHKS